MQDEIPPPGINRMPVWRVRPFEMLNARIASHYLLTYNPTAFVFVRFTPPREPLKSADHVGNAPLDHLPYSDHQHERRISPMRFGVCSCHTSIICFYVNDFTVLKPFRMKT